MLSSAAFSALVPARPYCADNLADGLLIRPREVAITKRHIQVNGPSALRWMPFDIDEPEAYFAHRDANLPPPNVIMTNPANGHGHAVYLLETPVAKHSASRVEPLRFYAAIERGLARRVNADRSYSGLIVKNPLHPAWRVEWRRSEPYSLHELSDWLFDRDTRPDPSVRETMGAGRNVTIFDELRAIAYREVRGFKQGSAPFSAWQDRCVKIAIALNTQFPRALPLSEVRSIARSVAKWTWRHFSDARFSSIQSARAAKRWHGHTAIEKLEPWKAAGVSRATYYRRKRHERSESPNFT